MNQRQCLHELYFKELLILVCQRSLHTELSISPLCIQKSSFPSPLWCYFKLLSIHPVTFLYLGGEVQIPYSFLLSLVFNLLILLISIWPRTVFLESATAQKKTVIKREKEKEIKEKESHRPPPPTPTLWVAGAGNQRNWCGPTPSGSQSVLRKRREKDVVS